MPGDAASPAHFPKKPILSYTFFFLALVFMQKAKQDLRIWGYFLPLQDTRAGTGTCVLVSTWHFPHVFCVGTTGQPDQRDQGERNYNYYQIAKKAN